MPDTDLLFRHPVGKSTLLQGFTVPLTAQSAEWAQLAKGEKRRVTFCYRGKEKAQVILRRINNARGHLQFRYEGNALTPFREWLRSQFTNDQGAISGALEVYALGANDFLVMPLRSSDAEQYHLTDTKLLCHGMPHQEIKVYPPFIEIVSLLRKIPYLENANQAHYNLQIRSLLQKNGWQAQVLAIPELPLRCDFAKEELLVEVEFGNARTYYQDYIKFALAGRRGRAKIGLLITPTAAFADFLCEIGRRAAEQRRTAGTKPVVYSGMMSYEKAEREFHHLSFLFTTPVAVIGLDLTR